jgi:hypothetical protein
MMRHTFATFLGSKGATDMDLMDLGGWKSVAMVRRYRKIVDERLLAEPSSVAPKADPQTFARQSPALPPSLCLLSLPLGKIEKIGRPETDTGLRSAT